MSPKQTPYYGASWSAVLVQQCFAACIDTLGTTSSSAWFSQPHSGFLLGETGPGLSQESYSGSPIILNHSSDFGHEFKPRVLMFATKLPTLLPHMSGLEAR